MIGDERLTRIILTYSAAKINLVTKCFFGFQLADEFFLLLISVVG